MTREAVFELLDSTDISREEDYAVPINGSTKKLPYMVVRTTETIEGADLGRVHIQKTEWIVALFTVNRDDVLEKKICKALSSVGRVEITRFPDGKPYQTNFEFTTRQTQTMK